MDTPNPKANDETEAIPSKGKTDPAIASLAKSVEALHGKIDAVGKQTVAVGKAVAAIDFREIEPSNPHEAIQRVKAEGSLLIGQALRDFSLGKFPKAFSDLAHINAKARAAALAAPAQSKGKPKK